MLADGRQTDNEIAKKIGATKDCVKKNFRKMEEMGIIKGATTHINYKSFGYMAVAHILINVESRQEDQFVSYLLKKPEVYSFYSRGVKGNWDIVITLKTLEQLNIIKDEFKRCFSILEMRTAIWTDVKEMNYNLAIIDNAGNDEGPVNYQVKVEKTGCQSMILDSIDQKIADKLSENGRISMETLGKEIGISTDTAKRRYEKLKKNGVLKVTIQISLNRIGYQAICVFFTVISNENSFVIIEKISRIPDVISIMKTTGDYDLQVWVMVKDLGQFLSVQEALGRIQGISKMDAEITSSSKWEKWPSPRQYISTF